MELTLDQAIQKGIEAHKAGKVQEADRYYTAILKADPKHPDANHNMGILAVGVNKVEAALPFLKTALESNPKIDQFWLSYIDALIKLNQIDEAKKVLAQAKSKGAKGDGFDKLEQRMQEAHTQNAKTQDPPEDQLKALVNLYTQGQYQEVQTQATTLIISFPTSVTLYNIFGAANQGLGKLTEAVEAFNKALLINPENADAHNNMGITLKEQGKLEEAIEAYRKAISLKPDYANAYNNMGNALKVQGKLDEAIEAYNKAILLKPDYTDAYNNMGIALNGVSLKQPNKDIQNAITFMLDEKLFVRPIDISKAAISLLKFEPNLRKHLSLVYSDYDRQNLLDIINELSELPLLLKLMSVCPLPDLQLENIFKNLRLSILKNISAFTEVSHELIHFLSVLALHCFTNEYIYNHSEEEEKILQSLEAIVKKYLDNNQQPSPQVTLTLASYKALNEYEWCNLLVVTDHIQEVFSRQVEEPKEEEKLKQDLPILEKITDSVSSEVRAQYEESPYPRWVNLGLPLQPMTISKVVDEVKLKLQDYKIIEIEKPEILIAGCGTGQHSIGTSTRFESSKVLAIDLSLSSLAYAKRKTEELGIKNIAYMHADILDVEKINKQFDIIESVGVLHHMDNPITGWELLTDSLKPGGLMKIGLYSALARQSVVKIKEEIKKLNIGSSDAAIKSCRNMIIQSDEITIQQLLDFSDFYSMSQLRDLLFHVQEHRFTISLIKNHLDKLGLHFCGFESNEVVSHFKQSNRHNKDPYDLDKWQAYEEVNPRAFAGMYQFWCQKVG